MKKLPIIGLFVGAAAALLLRSKNKKQPEIEVQGAAQAPTEDTVPPA